MSADRRAEILAAAQEWLGTPYRHGARTKGVGCDCLGLALGIWGEIYGQAPEPIPAYGPAWAEAGAPDRLEEGLSRHLTPIDPAAARPGDLLLLRRGTAGPAAHVGFVGSRGRLIHAYARRAVIETRLTPALRRTIAAAFRFPGA